MVHHWWEFTAGQQHVRNEEGSGRPSIIIDDIVELVQEHIVKNIRFTITELNSHFLLLIAQNCHGALVVQEIAHQVDAKATDTRTQNQLHGVIIDMSAVVP